MTKPSSRIRVSKSARADFLSPCKAEYTEADLAFHEGALESERAPSSKDKLFVAYSRCEPDSPGGNPSIQRVVAQVPASMDLHAVMDEIVELLSPGGSNPMLLCYADPDETDANELERLSLEDAVLRTVEYALRSVRPGQIALCQFSDFMRHMLS